MSTAIAPIKRENQHYVLCQGIGDPAIGCPMSVLRFYAKTPEAAVAEARKMYRFDDYGQAQEPSEDSARIAVAWELPWNQPTESIVIKLKGSAPFVGDYPEAVARDLYGDEIEFVRAPTATELEESMRFRDLDEDERADEEFARGWDDYKFQLENGLDA